MAQFVSFLVNKQEVERGETFTYTAWVKNTLSSAATLKINFYENTPDHMLNIQSATVEGGGTTAFQLNLDATQYPGYEYCICAWVEDGTGKTASECAPRVHIRDESAGLTLVDCTVDKTEVDGGATVQYAMTVVNDSRITQYAYVQFWDFDLDEVIYENESALAAGERMTFEHQMVCAALGRRYRVCARLVNALGKPIGITACAPPVQVSDQWGMPVYQITGVVARASRIELDDPYGFGVVVSVANTGSSGGVPMVDFVAVNTETGEETDYGARGAYIAEGATVEFDLTNSPPGDGIYEVVATVRGTGITRSVVVGVGRDPTPPIDEPEIPDSESSGIPPVAIMLGTALIGGAAFYLLGPELGIGGDTWGFGGDA